MKKKLKKKMTVPIVMLMLSIAGYSQVNKQDQSYGVTQKQTRENGTVSYVSFDLKKTAYKKGDHEKIFKEQLALKNGADFKSISTNTDAQNFTHEKFQFSYQGIPVEFSTYYLHYKEGKLESMNGDLFNYSNLTITPSISKEDGLQIAIQISGASHFLWENQQEAALMNYKKPEGELVFLPVKENGKETLKLAYRYFIYANNPLIIADIYVDAITGEKLLVNSRVCIHENKDELSVGINNTNNTNTTINNSVAKTGSVNGVMATGSAATKYSGTQQIETSSSGANFILKDASRNIHTYSMKGGIDNFSNALEITDNDNNWTAAEFHNATNDDAALDAHWGSAHFYDYFKETHLRNSFDGAGGEIKNYVGTDLKKFNFSNNENAFWNGQFMVYGTGGTIMSPFSNVQIVAHEIGHGLYFNVIGGQSTNDAPGAINEGLSDIWSICVTDHTNMGKEKWLLGAELGKVLRSFSNPKDTKLPDTYLMTNWARTNSDNGGVHINSNIIPYWFYILSQGKTGTNDLGNNYSVSGIGMDKAAKIIYKMETSYLTINSNFEDFRTLTIKAAIDLFNDGSNEVIQVTNAFYAIGLGSAYNVNGSDTQKPNAPVLNSGSAVTATDVTLSWSAATDNVGIKYYVINYEGREISSTTNTFERFNKTISGNTTSYKLNGLFPGHNYDINVTALDSSGNAAVSNTITIATLYHQEIQDPSAPVLTSDVVGSNYSTFHWTAATDNIGIKEYHILLNGNQAKVANRNILNGFVSSLTALTTYTVEIEAVDFSGNTSISNEIIFTTHSNAADTQNPSSPSLSFSNIGYDKVELNWTPSTDDREVVGYYIYKGQNLLFFEDILNNTPQYKFVATGLTPGTQYYFKVVARDVVGKRSASPNFSSVTTLSDFVAPSVPLNLLGKSITNTSVKLTWDFSTDNTGIKEYWIYKNSVYLQTVKGNVANITGLNQGTTYNFYVVAVDNYNNVSLPSNTITINTAGNNNNSSGYCTINGDSYYMYIDQVSSFSSSGANGGYKDFTSNTPINSTIGSAFNLNLKAGFSGNVYSAFWEVWIDYNKNNIFEAGEKIISTTSADANLFTATGTIPATVTPVTTRMRVIMSYYTIVDACTKITFGEAEDYTIKLNAGNSTSAYCNITGNTQFEYIDKVGASANSGDNGGYKDFSTTTNLTGPKVGASFNLDLKPGYKSTPYTENWGVWIDFNKNNIFESTERILTNTSTNGNVFTANLSVPATASSGVTTMRIIMSANVINSACDAIQFGEAEDYSITIDPASVTPPTSAYCTAGGGSSSEFIDRVAGFTNSGDNGGYKDFTNSTITGLSVGNSFGLDLKAGFSGTTAYKENWAVWIDFNNNKTFEDVEKVISTTSNDANLFTATGTVPSNALIGKTRMRIMMNYLAITSPCGTFTYGEVEDYTVDIVAGTGGGAAPTFTYCNIKGTTTWEYINLFGTQNTGNNNGYLNNTGVKLNMLAGSLNQFNIQTGFTGNNTYNEYWSIWVDMNQNSTFETNENVLSNYLTNDNQVHLIGFTPDQNSKPGKTTMRIIMSDNQVNDPCITSFNGEAEDYSVEIIGGTGIIVDPNNGTNYSNNNITGINENQSENRLNIITVSPTPSADFIQLSKQFQSNATYQIVNALGELVRNSQIFDSEKINIHDLNSGIYFIQVKEGNTVYLGKIIKR